MKYKLVLSDPCLFSWDNIPGKDNLKLIELLNRYFDIEWLKAAEIEKIENDRTIKVFGGGKSLSLKLDAEKTKVELEINDCRTSELIAKMENNKLNIYEITKDIADNVFFNDLPSDYEVYVLYYPGTSSNIELTDKLRDLGNITGKNLFVNIAKLNDPNYKKIVNIFEIEKFPTIIITAIDKLASNPTEHSTAYVKIDNKKLLNKPDLAADCIDKVFNLFIQGKVSKAISEQSRSTNIFLIKDLIDNAFKGMKDYLREWEISFSFITGTLEIKSTGGDNA